RPAPEAEPRGIDPAQALEILDAGELGLQVAVAHPPVVAVLPLLAEEERRAVVDGEGDVAALAHHLLPAAPKGPLLLDLLRARPAVVEDERRVAARRIEAGGFQEARRQLDAARAVD